MKKTGKLILIAAALAALVIGIPSAKNRFDPQTETVGAARMQPTASAQPPSAKDAVAPQQSTALSDRSQSVTAQDRQTVLAQSRILGSLYREIYLQAEKTPSPYWGDAGELTQPWKDEIEDVLIEAGHPVANSDGIYPEYLENADAVSVFWDSVTAGNDAHAEFWGISPDGGLFYTGLSFQGGTRSVTYGSAKWNSENEMELISLEKREVRFWSMTRGGDFYYQDRYLDRHWDATRLIRLHPVQKELHDLNRKYILPIGYHNVNLFLVDWDAEDYGDLCFNDLLGGLYLAEHGEHLYAADFPYTETPYFHSEIPAALFEDTILPHFDISLDALRQRTLYDPESSTYPWQDVAASNVIYYPSVIPEVTDCISLGDDTFRLTVRVMCTDYHSDHVLTHEVTIREQPDGGWQYLGNRVTQRDAVEQPSPQARIEAQRTADRERARKDP